MGSAGVVDWRRERKDFRPGSRDQGKKAREVVGCLA